MHIDPKAQIAGLPSTQVRRLLRWLGTGFMSARQAADHLKVDVRKAEEVISELESLGFLCRFQDGWAATDEGGRLAVASAMPKISRQTADRLVRELLERVERLNEDPQYAYYVERIEVFGSYVAGAERLSDVDIAVSISPRFATPAEQATKARERVDFASRTGQLRGTFDFHTWPQAEVFKVIRAGSRYISLQHESELVHMETTRRVLYDRGHRDAASPAPNS